jgi:hypothetical protein
LIVRLEILASLRDLIRTIGNPASLRDLIRTIGNPGIAARLDSYD